MVRTDSVSARRTGKGSSHRAAGISQHDLAIFFIPACKLLHTLNHIIPMNTDHTCETYRWHSKSGDPSPDGVFHRLIQVPLHPPGHLVVLGFTLGRDRPMPHEDLDHQDPCLGTKLIVPKSGHDLGNRHELGLSADRHKTRVVGHTSKHSTSSSFGLGRMYEGSS